MGLTRHVVSGPVGRLERVWTAACDSPTDFTSVAKANPMITIARVAGTTTVHLRGPETRATALSCPRDAEYIGAELRLGTYLPMFPPARLADLRDAVLPTLPDGRVLLDDRAWEMPTAQNIDVLVDRLERAGLVVFDPLVEELGHGETTGDVPERTAQSRFVRAVGLSRRDLRVIERARLAARLLHAGEPIADVVYAAGYYDQPHLTRALRRLIGHTPAALGQSGQFLACPKLLRNSPAGSRSALMRRSRSSASGRSASARDSDRFRNVTGWGPLVGRRPREVPVDVEDRGGVCTVPHDPAALQPRRLVQRHRERGEDGVSPPPPITVLTVPVKTHRRESDGSYRNAVLPAGPRVWLMSLAKQSSAGRP